MLRLVGFRLFVMHLVMTVQNNYILSYYVVIIKYAHRTPKWIALRYAALFNLFEQESYRRSFLKKFKTNVYCTRSLSSLIYIYLILSTNLIRDESSFQWDK